MALDRGYEDDHAERLLVRSRKVGKSPDYVFWTDCEDKKNSTIASVYNGAVMLKMTVFGPGVKSPRFGQAGMVRLRDGTIALATAKHNHISDEKAGFLSAIAEFKGPYTFVTSLKPVEPSSITPVNCLSEDGIFPWRYGIDISIATFLYEPSQQAPWNLDAFHVFELVPTDFELVSRSALLITLAIGTLLTHMPVHEDEGTTCRYDSLH